MRIVIDRIPRLWTDHRICHLPAREHQGMNHVFRRLTLPTITMTTFIPAHTPRLTPTQTLSTTFTQLNRKRHRYYTRPSRRVHLHPLPVRASVQQETDWNFVKILENSPICEDHRYIVVDVGTTDAKGSLADTYRTPGQYVQIRLDQSTKPGFFAISCAPNIQGVFEFLIKESPNISWFTSCQPGDVVEMSPVQGKGFPIMKLDLLSYPPIPEEDVPKDVLLFATGSGIAPIRAAIESLLNGLRIPERRSVKLFYGARYSERMAYMDRFKLWEADGVQVIPVMSQPDKGKTAWHGKRGYVQHVLNDIGIDHPRQTGALLCGVKGMTQDVTDILVDAGVPKDRILMNF